MYIIVFFAILALSSVTANSLIQPELNPGCKQCSANETILVYIKAQDDSFDHIVHQVWDFTGHAPSMLYIVGDKTSSIRFLWDEKKPKEIIPQNSFYSFAMILNNLFEYNDTDADKVYFDYNYPHRDISLRDVTWRLDESVLTNYRATVRVLGDLSWEKHRMNGTIDIKLLLVPTVGRSAALPRLYHTVNTTQVDVGLVGLTVAPHYTAGRFALRYVIVSEDRANEDLKIDVVRSIDDEYTPGVFETINILSPSGERGPGGFVQYRPVAYTENARDVENSVTAHVDNYNRTKIPHDCLVETYYSRFDPDNVFVNEVVASFGQSGDGYYNKTNYTVWTYSVGYGTPPAEGASVFLVVVLTLGIATPLVALACSYVVSVRMARRHRERLLRDERA